MISKEFLTGVYWDTRTAQFVSLAQTDDGIELRSPDGEDVWEVVEDADEIGDDEFVEVPTDAVERPAEYAVKRLMDLADGDLNPTGRPTYEEEVGTRFVLETTDLAADWEV